mgnify:CR=1 FL=1
MRTSEQKPDSTVPTAQHFSQKDSNVVFSAPSASRAVFMTDGVTEIQGIQYLI